jgi:hypothetical protein
MLCDARINPMNDKTPTPEIAPTGKILPYQSSDGSIKIDV